MKLNPRQAVRDNLIFGTRPEYHGGIAYFEDISGELLASLVERKYADPESRYNYSPSIQEFLDFIKQYPACTVSGFVVEKDRADYGVVISTLRWRGEFGKGDIIAFVRFSQGSDNRDDKYRETARRVEVSEDELYTYWL